MYINFVVLVFLFRKIYCQEERYIGCYQRKAISDSAEISDKDFGNVATVDLCVQECLKDNAARYAALSIGQICRCASTIDESKRTQGCSRPCEGEPQSSQLCGGGGPGPHSVYEIVPVTTTTETTPPIGTSRPTLPATTTTETTPSLSTSRPTEPATTATKTTLFISTSTSAESSSISSITTSHPSSSASSILTPGAENNGSTTLSTITKSSVPNETLTMSVVLTSTAGSKPTDEPKVVSQTPTGGGFDIIPAVIGGVSGFVAILLITLAIFCFCRRKRNANKYGKKILNDEAELHQYSEMEAQNKENGSAYNEASRTNGGHNNTAYDEVNNKTFHNDRNIYDQAAKEDGAYDKLHTNKQHNSKLKQQTVSDDTYDHCPSAKDDDTYNELNVKKPEYTDDTYDHTKNILQQNDGTYDEFNGKREEVDDTYDHTKNILQENDGTYDEFRGKREEVDDTYDHTKNILRENDGTYDEFRGKREEVDDTYDHTKNILRENEGTYDVFGGKREQADDTYDHT